MLRCMPAREKRARSLPRSGDPHRESAPNRPRTDRTRVPPCPVRWPRRSRARSSDRNGRRGRRTASARRPVSVAPARAKSRPDEHLYATGTCSVSSVKSDSAAGKNDPCDGNQVSSFAPHTHTHTHTHTHLCARSSR